MAGSSEFLQAFGLDGFSDESAYGEGHINRSFLIYLEGRPEYIAQRINDSVFHDIPALMRNIETVTEHLKRRCHDSRRFLSLLHAADGKPYAVIGGEYFRVYRFIEDSMCLQRPGRLADFRQSGIAFGRFSESLSDLDVSELAEVIPDFHNTPKRYRSFCRSVSEDRLGRACGVQKEIDFILEREDCISQLQQMRDSGDLPVRVTHNDAKLNNVLFDRRTREALCVIDLDTVMPGLSLYDFGDAIRFGASSADEDEKDLDKVQLSLELYRAFAEGYCSACSSLTQSEAELLALGAKTMTIECGMRFLQDYIDGDVYFRIDRERHNLDRARTQLKLLYDMERHWDEMNRIALECFR